MSSPEALLIAINDLMQEESLLAALGSFLWGCAALLLSPCQLASVPLLISYIAGRNMDPRKATGTSLCFTVGMFLSIALIGSLCAYLGTMLGQIPPILKQATGLLLIFLGLKACRRPCCTLKTPQTNLKGAPIALLLGLLYGLLSGSCTFAFLAPIMAMITMQQNLTLGLSMSISFAMGHTLPIVLAGRLVSTFSQRTSHIIRIFTGVLITATGLFFCCFP